MTTDTNLQFIREKIYEIRHAVMYSMSNGLVRIPNSIVSVIKVDNDGQIWFLCTPPMQKVEECECVFPARLQFYKKGKFFRLEVSGKATVMNNEYSVDSTEEKKDKPILIKMSMTNIEYTSTSERKEKGKIESILENSYKWLLRNVAIPREEKSVFSKLHQTH
jgi:general stress protein 26